jgi:Holliday junction resolvase
MNTGSGKTLVSLLMLYSKMIEGVGPSLYLCPDNQLLEQTKNQAKLYGVPVCEIEQPGNQFPTAFLNSKSILLCTFQRLFTGRSIFERDNIRVGAIVLDDAHKCLDKSREATTVHVPYDYDLGRRLLELFKDDLKYQAPGTFYNLIQGDPHASVLKVPYWSWLSKQEQLIELLGKYSEDKEMLFFKWPLIADDLRAFDCYFGQKGLEIAPLYVPYQNVRAFNEAKHRYILSATFEGQIDLVKDLGIEKSSVQNPLIPKNRKDIGQRLIIAPQRFDPEIEDEDLRLLGQKYASEGKNIVVMVPSFERSQSWKELGASVITNDNISDSIADLKANKGRFYVLVNRYDGIDLAGDMCRVLIIDGYPGFSSYKQLHTEMRLESVRSSLKAQIIDQGLGRAVRSGSDFCSIILMGKDLLRFVGHTYNLQYFTPFTRKQLDVGLQLLDDEENDDSLKVVTDTIEACLSQEDNWRQFHSQMLDEVDPDENNNRLDTQLDIAKVELDSINLFRRRAYEAAAENILQKLIGSSEISDKQRGWYFELAARYYYPQNTGRANDLQIKASTTASHMLQPKTGYEYKKIRGSEEQVGEILRYAKNFGRAEDYKIAAQDLVSNLKFSKEIPHRVFETAFAELGRLLGFYTQEPEEEFGGKGPDVLWALADGHFLVIEAKSQSNQDHISRDSIEQLLHSEVWFKNKYGTALSYNLVLLQSPQTIERNAIASEECCVIDEVTFEKLKENVLHFVNGLVNYGHLSATHKNVAELLGNHNLTSGGIRDAYLKKIKSR